MNGGQRNGTNAQIWGNKTTRIMMATVPHVIYGLGLRKFQADGFLLTRVYNISLYFCTCLFQYIFTFIYVRFFSYIFQSSNLIR